jgi:hypothetical protein
MIHQPGCSTGWNTSLLVDLKYAWWGQSGLIWTLVVIILYLTQFGGYGDMCDVLCRTVQRPDCGIGWYSICVQDSRQQPGFITRWYSVIVTGWYSITVTGWYNINVT